VTLWYRLVTLVELLALEDVGIMARFGITVAEGSFTVVTGVVELASHFIQRVRAVPGGIGTVASSDRELIGRHKVAPLLDLNPLAFLTLDVSRIDKAT